MATLKMSYSGIRDPDVRSALETLAQEFEYKEDRVRELDSEIDTLNDKINDLEAENAALENKITELEEALAEAYLTSEVESKPCNESLVSQTSTED